MKKNILILGLVTILIVSGFSTVSFGKSNQISTKNNKMYLTEVTRCELPENMYPKIIEDGLAYGTGETGFIIVDINDLDNLKIIGKYESDDTYSDLYKQGDFVYISDDLLVLDVSDPSNPKYQTSIEGYSVSDVVVRDRYVFTSTYTGGIKIFNIHDPDNPTDPELISSLEIYYITDIELNNDYLITVSFVEGLKVVDIRYPSMPKIIGSYPGDLLFQPYSVKIQNNVAFINDYHLPNNEIGGINIIDLSNPKNPSLISKYDIQYPSSVSVQNNYLFTEAELFDETWNHDSLVVLDITDLNNPNPICYYMEPPAVGRIEIINDLFYLIQRGRIITYKFSNENNPPLDVDHFGWEDGHFRVGQEMKFEICGADRDNEEVYYEFKWDESGSIDTYGPFPSGTEFTVSHIFNSRGEKTIYGRIKDINGACSEWVADSFFIYSKSKSIIPNLLSRLLENSPVLHRILKI